MTRYTFLLAAVLAWTSAGAATTPADGADADPLRTLRAAHPRLLFTAGDQARIAALAATDAELRALIADNQARATGLLDAPTAVHKLKGPRLLGQSRRAEETIAVCALARRMNGDPRFAARAVKEMLAAAAFPDWNPPHFLDVAEMTAALAIGYDWLYADLKPEERALIRTAIVEKGLKPGLAVYRKGGGWAAGHNNWCQVCNAGLTLGALAVADEEPAVAREVVTDALASLPRLVHVYEPDGAYPEGPGYWEYGTTYHCLMLRVLRTALGREDATLVGPGLAKTGDFVIQSLGPTRQTFNYADAHEGFSPSPAMFVLADRFQRPDWAAWYRARLAEGQHGGRFDPLNVAFYLPGGRVSALPTDAYFHGQQELVFLRSAWDDPQALYFAVKGGDNKASHGHLDLGSFVLDAGGVRWAKDLGGDDYDLPGYWGSGEGGSRWKLFRLGTLSHNTLTIGGQLQRVAATATFTSFQPGADGARAITDLSAAYAGQAKQVRRGVRRLGAQGVLVQDEVLAPTGAVRWAMATEAKVQPDGARALLTQGGRKLFAQVLSPAGAKFEAAPARPSDPAENPNDGVTMLTVTAPPPAKPDEVLRLSIWLAPEDGKTRAPAPAPALRPLAEW